MSFQPKPLFFQVFIYIVFFCKLAFAEKKDSLKTPEPLKATANINITNNGISLFPNLMLGKPATIINLSVGKKGIYFEPELRWGLTGKPWSYIFWLRYKYRNAKKFGFHTGFHPSYIIREGSFDINGKPEKRYITTRYFAGDLAPTFYISKKFYLGIYMLYSKGLDSYATQNSYFAAIQPRFPNIGISKKYYLAFYPQVFHLTLDSKKGFYFSETLSLNRTNLPLYLSSIFTYKINSTIPGSAVVWNVGLNLKL